MGRQVRCPVRLREFQAWHGRQKGRPRAALVFPASARYMWNAGIPSSRNRYRGRRVSGPDVIVVLRWISG